MAKTFDIAIIGGGIVGMASAKTLANKTEASLIVLEAEDQLAAHQTGNNSGVIHSGLYYKPGSLKARTCTDGREALYTFCEEHGVAYERCGKVVVATSEEEIPRLRNLQERGTANGLRDLTWLSGEEIQEYEPHVTGVAGLHVPQTGIVDYTEVTSKYADIVKSRDGEIRTNAEVIDCQQNDNEFILVTMEEEIHCRNVINCAGLQSDRVARMFGAEPDVKIVPFRGEYYELKPEKHHLVNNLIYPVPDPKFPFLGVHFTRMIHGGVEAGPNAVLALEREGYTKWDVSVKDTLDTLTYGGFWKLAGKFWKTGFGEVYRSFSKGAFVRALQKLIPELSREDVTPGGAGVRAQALDSNGKLIDDFRIVELQGMIHVLNAPSPAATASISIGQTIADMASKNFDLN